MRDASFARPLRVSPWFLLLLATLPAIAFALHFRGHMVLGWDSEPSLRPDLYLKGSLSAWNWRAYLGQPNVFQISQAPLALLYWLLSLTPWGVEGADKLMLTGLFGLPAFTMYYCARRLFPRDPWLPFAAAWCYALSPLLFVRFYVPIMTVQLDYALLPLLANVWIDIARRGAGGWRLVWLAAVEMAFWPCGNNLAYWLVPHATAVLLVILAVWRGGDGAWKTHVRSIVQGLIVTAVINAFWVLPVVMFGLFSGSNVEHEAITKAYTSGVRQDVAQGSGLSWTLRMSSKIETGAGDLYGPYWTYARSLENGLVVAPYYLWILVVMLAMALRWRDRRVVVLGLLLCGALFVMKGESPPLEFVLQTFYKIPLLGTIFRNGNDKLLPMAAFAMALLLPIGVSALGRKTRYPRAWQAALLLVVFAMAYPYWTGQMFMARPSGPTLSSKPPDAAFEFARGLDALPSRLLFLPVSDNPQLLTTRWGFYGPNVYGSMTDAMFVANPESTLNSPGADAVTTDIYSAIRSGDVASFVSLTTITGSGYVFVAHDMDPMYYGGPPPSQIDTFLAKIPGTQIASIVGPYTLWRLPWVAGVNHDLVRRRMAGYDTSFEAALALLPLCGPNRPALVALSKDASCAIARSPLLPPAATADSPPVEPQLNPLQAVVRDGRLMLTREDGSGATTSTRLPAGTVAAYVDSMTVGSEPVALSLLPCQLYRVQTYATRGPALPAAPSFALPALDGAYVPLPRVEPGAQMIDIRTTRNGTGASLFVADSVSGDAVLDAGKVSPKVKQLVFTALPGRAYQLVLGTDGPLLMPRSFVGSMTIQPVSLGAPLVALAPPEGTTAPCPAPPAATAYALSGPVLPSTAALHGRTLLVTTSDSTPGRLIAYPLPRDATMVRIGNDFVGGDGYDLPLPTGAPLVAGLYRATGPPRRLALYNLAGETDVTVANADRAGGTAVVRATTASEQWMRISMIDGCTGECVVSVRAGSLLGIYGVSVVDKDSSTVIATEKGVRKPQISLGFHAEAGAPRDLYIYTEPLPDVDHSSLQVASITVTPVVGAGATTIALPRVVPSMLTDAGASTVTAAPNAVDPPLQGSVLPPSAVASVLVLDTQYDPFWTTLVRVDRFPFWYFPQHVVADGYKNAWVVPAGLGGTVVRFYLLDLIAGIGLVVAGAMLLVLIARALRSRGQAHRA